MERFTVATSRTNRVATIDIDHSKCTSCGLCASVCKGKPLDMKDGELRIDQNTLFGCIGCGQCVAICPTDAISISGRCLGDANFFRLADLDRPATYTELSSLLQRRRSTRQFRNEPVERDLLESVIAAASTAPMGIPPSDVSLLVLDSVAKVNEFSFDYIGELRRITRFLNPFILKLMKPFVGKATYELLDSFAMPLIDFVTDRAAEGENWLLYSAPAAIYFYSSLYADPADPTVAATYAMLAAESLGLGTCMIGSVGPMLGRTSSGFLQKYKLPRKHNPGVILLLGYPSVKYRKGIARSFASVDFV